MKTPSHGQVLLLDVRARLCNLWEFGEQHTEQVAMGSNKIAEKHGY